MCRSVPHGVQQSLNQGPSFFNSPCPPPAVLGQLTGGDARQDLGLCLEYAPRVFFKACSFFAFKTNYVILIPIKDTAGQLGAESAIQWMVLRRMKWKTSRRAFYLIANSELGFSCYISILNSSKNSLGVLLRNMNKHLNKSHVHLLYKSVGTMQICDLFSFRNLPEMVANMN